MKGIIHLLILLCLASNSFGMIKVSEPSKDSVGVYLTEADYLNNHLSFKSSVLPKSYFFPFYSNIHPKWTEVIGSKVKFMDDSLGWKTFKHGNAFGFYINGHKYIYVKGFRRYLQVIHESPFYFYLDIDNIRSQKYRVLYFAKNLNETPTLFNKKYIRKLNINASCVKILLNLYHSITGLFGYTSVGWSSYKSYIDTIYQYMEQYRKTEEENKDSSSSIYSIQIKGKYSFVNNE